MSAVAQKTPEQIAAAFEIAGNVIQFPDAAPQDADSGGDWNDAAIYGPEPAGTAEFMAQPATFLIGEMWGAKDRRNTQDGHWQAVTMPWGRWIEGGPAEGRKPAWGLSRHPEGKHKAGAAVVLGSSVGRARKAAAMDKMYALGLDIDSGAVLDDVIDTIRRKNILALIYTTHSHGKAGLELKRDVVIKKLGIATDPTLSQVQTYLRDHSKSRYEESFIDAVTIADQKCQRADGVKIVLDTPPLDKFRIIFPLAEAVKLIDLAPTQDAALDLWADKITGMARRELGIHFDTSCTDPSRLFFTARHPEGAEWDCLYLRGAPLRFEDVPTMAKAEYARGRAGRKVERHFTESGVDLNDWYNKSKERLQMADLIRTYDPNKVREDKGGLVEIECPFDHEHSNAGDSTDSACIAVDALDARNDRGTIFCQHDSCQDRKNAEFLVEMLAQGWFTEEQLFDEDAGHLLDPGEEDTAASAAVQQEDTAADVAFCSDIRAPLYDEDLVDGEGFIRAPAECRALYDKYGIKAGASDEDKQKAYKAAVALIRTQIKESMRARFSYVVTGDKARAGVRTAPGRDVSWYDEGALDRLFRNREVSFYTLNGKGEPKVEKLKPSVLFMYDRDRATFSHTEFEPDPVKAAAVEGDGGFNVWTGFAVEPAAGDWSLLRDHVLDVICGGDVALFHWHMTFIASLFARPGVKVPSSIAVKGEQGTGKSKLWDWVRAGIGCAAMKVSQGKHLVGQFNGHLDGKLLLVCEEAFWAGDKAAAGVIKDLISAEELTIEAKHQNAVTRRNRIVIVFISNNDWIIPTDGADARRFAVLDATDAHKQDSAYFAAIDAQMQNGGLEAMVHELTHWDPKTVGLTWDSLRTPPETEALRQQAGMGLSGPLAALVGIIEEGIIDGRTASGEVFNYNLSDTEPTRVARSHLNTVLGIKKGRGNETVAGIKAIETLFGDGAVHSNKDHVTFEGSVNADGGRDSIRTDDRVRYVDVPALDDLKPVLAVYGRG